MNKEVERCKKLEFGIMMLVGGWAPNEILFATFYVESTLHSAYHLSDILVDTLDTNLSENKDYIWLTTV